MFKSPISRRTVVKAAAVLALAATAFTSLPAQAQSTLEKAKAEGFIRVGFANEAPFGYATPDGKLTGEAPEVAKAVLAKMGIAQVDGVLTEFGSLIPGPQGRALRHHRRRHVHQSQALRRDQLLRAVLRHRPGHAGA